MFVYPSDKHYALIEPSGTNRNWQIPVVPAQRPLSAAKSDIRAQRLDGPIVLLLGHSTWPSFMRPLIHINVQRAAFALSWSRNLRIDQRPHRVKSE
jgi:hypothetical protein